MPPLTDFPGREIAPATYRQRMEPQFEKVDPQIDFQNDFVAFQAESAHFQAASAQHVYDNPDADQGHYRVHCYWLATLIARGQHILHQATLAQLPGIELEKQLIQKQLDTFIALMHDWHGAPGTHIDEPASFGEAMRDVDNNDVVPCQF